MHTTLDGEGARLYGGRWNPEGTPMVYAAGSRSLAALEYLVHLDVASTPDNLVLLTVQIPDDVRVDSIELAALPDGWTHVADHPFCVNAGDAWQQSASSLALRVPSALMPEESIYLINPSHPDIGRVTSASRPFAFDRRLVES